MTTLAFVSAILSINRLIDWLIIAALSPVEAPWQSIFRPSPPNYQRYITMMQYLCIVFYATFCFSVLSHFLHFGDNCLRQPYCNFLSRSISTRLQCILIRCCGSPGQLRRKSATANRSWSQQWNMTSINHSFHPFSGRPSPCNKTAVGKRNVVRCCRRDDCKLCHQKTAEMTKAIYII